MIVLGGQLIVERDTISKSINVVPARHTSMRAHAAGIAYQRGLTPRFIVCGRYNAGVRYIPETNSLITPSDFSFEAFALAPIAGPSEAEIICGLLYDEYYIPYLAVIREMESATTQENAQCVRMILSRSLGQSIAGTNLKDLERIGLLTNLYHMGSAVTAFREQGLEVKAVFAEDMLALDHHTNRTEEVVDYYREPRGGKQWDYLAIREIMTAVRLCGDLSRSVGELLQ